MDKDLFHLDRVPQHHTLRSRVSWGPKQKEIMNNHMDKSI